MPCATSLCILLASFARFAGAIEVGSFGRILSPLGPALTPADLAQAKRGVDLCNPAVLVGGLECDRPHAATDGAANQGAPVVGSARAPQCMPHGVGCAWAPSSHGARCRWPHACTAAAAEPATSAQQWQRLQDAGCRVCQPSWSCRRRRPSNELVWRAGVAVPWRRSPTQWWCLATSTRPWYRHTPCARLAMCQWRWRIRGAAYRGG